MYIRIYIYNYINTHNKTTQKHPGHSGAFDDSAFGSCRTHQVAPHHGCYENFQKIGGL